MIVQNSCNEKMRGDYCVTRERGVLVQGNFEKNRGLLWTAYIVALNGSALNMATKKAAESTLYHLSPKGFWKKFRGSSCGICSISNSLIFRRRRGGQSWNIQWSPSPCSQPLSAACISTGEVLYTGDKGYVTMYHQELPVTSAFAKPPTPPRIHTGSAMFGAHILSCRS